MANDPFEQFRIPDEFRTFAEQSVEQARKAFEGFMEAAHKAMGQAQGHAEAAHGGATEIAQKSMAYAEQNVAATMEFAQKLMHAKDGAELMALQSEFLGRQMQALSSHRSLVKVPPSLWSMLLGLRASQVRFPASS